MPKHESRDPIEILMVEDNPGDVRLTKEALKQTAVPHHFNVVEDGEQAMLYLKQEVPYEDAHRPQLILLDLNLPGKSGREILGEIKSNAQYVQIPVVMFTSSDSLEDTQQCYARHANAFVTKPREFDSFVGAVKALEDFWLEHVTLPLLS